MTLTPIRLPPGECSWSSQLLSTNNYVVDPSIDRYKVPKHKMTHLGFIFSPSYSAKPIDITFIIVEDWEHLKILNFEELELVNFRNIGLKNNLHSILIDRQSILTSNVFFCISSIILWQSVSPWWRRSFLTSTIDTNIW